MGWHPLGHTVPDRRAQVHVRATGVVVIIFPAASDDHVTTPIVITSTPCVSNGVAKSIHAARHASITSRLRRYAGMALSGYRRLGLQL
jgi:hypothetical protein